jgi:hypothetical protein
MGRSVVPASRSGSPRALHLREGPRIKNPDRFGLDFLANTRMHAPPGHGVDTRPENFFEPTLHTEEIDQAELWIVTGEEQVDLRLLVSSPRAPSRKGRRARSPRPKFFFVRAQGADDGLAVHPGCMASPAGEFKTRPLPGRGRFPSARSSATTGF